MTEQYSEVDFDFNPADFLVSSEWVIDRTFWEHLDENCTVPSSLTCKTRFYAPKERAAKGWPEKLKAVFGVEPYVMYEQEILNLPNEITAEEIESTRITINRYGIESQETMKPIPPPKKLAVEEYLRHKSMRLTAQLCFADNGEQVWNNLSEKEKRIYRWTADYGFLWDHRDGAGVLFPGPKDEKALKFEVLNEYFFHVKQFPGLILSVAQEPNTDRAIYGFRREARVDWPFDKVWMGVEKDENGKVGPRYENIADKIVERQIVTPMNRLIRNIEYLLSK